MVVFMQINSQYYVENRWAWIAPDGGCSHCGVSEIGKTWWDICPHYGKMNGFYKEYKAEEFLGKYREEILIPYIDQYEPTKINVDTIIHLSADRHQKTGRFDLSKHIKSIPLYPREYSIGSIDCLVDHCIFIFRYLMEEFSRSYPNAKLVVSFGSSSVPSYAVTHAFSELRDEYTSLNWKLYELHYDENRGSEDHEGSDGKKGYHMMENIVNKYRQLLKEKEQLIAHLQSKISDIK